MRVKAIKSNKQ